MIKSITIFCLAPFLLACQQKPSPPSIFFFEAGVNMGTIEGKEIREASGLVESINNPGFLWTHNDSGNEAEIFLINKTGEVITTVKIEGVKNRDWEDITVGPGPESGKQYVYIGEIGDNKAVFDFKFIYRIEEPVLNGNVADTAIEKIETIKFTLPDGARDAEALMIDPQTKDLYIFSKREDNINLYKLPFPQSTKEVITAELVASKLPFTMIVAADISKDGKEVLIKNYDHVYYWNRSENEMIGEVLKRTPVTLPYAPEPQGESIAFDRDGKGYYTLSEKKGKALQQLFFYKRKNK